MNSKAFCLTLVHQIIFILYICVYTSFISIKFNLISFFFLQYNLFHSTELRGFLGLGRKFRIQISEQRGQDGDRPSHPSKRGPTRDSRCLELSRDSGKEFRISVQSVKITEPGKWARYETGKCPRNYRSYKTVSQRSFSWEFQPR